MIMASGNLFIISAPSGTGKTTVLRQVINGMDNIAFSVSHTTRQPRPGEQTGVDYYFVEKDVFVSMEQQGLFLEWASVHGNLYGTSDSVVQESIDRGQDIILDIDVQGARQVRDKLGKQGIFIFIAPPSLDELSRRLAGRATESETAIATRLANAAEEMKSIDDYDYVIVNDTVNQAVEILRSIIIAERSRKRRNIAGEPLTIDFFK